MREHLKRVAKVYTGSTPPTNIARFYDSEDVFWISPGDITSNGIKLLEPKKISNSFFYENGIGIYPANVVLMVGIGATVGKVGFFEKPCYTNQQINAIVFDKHKVLPKFGAYFLLNMSSEINRKTPVVTLQIFNQSKVKQIMIDYPSLSTQQSMVDYLEEKLAKIDERIAVLEKQQDAYVRLKKSVIHQAVTRGLNPNVPLKDSGIEWIGMIPQHWEVKRMKDIFPTYSTGLTPESKDETNFSENERYTWVTIGDMNSKVVNSSNMCLSDKVIDEKSPILSPKGSLLFSFKLSIGKTAFAGKDLYTNEAIVTIPPRKAVELNFFYYIIPQVCLDNATENIYGAKMLNQKIIANMLFVFPPLSEQQAIATYLDDKCAKIDAAIENIRKQIDASKRLKRALINEVITGQRAV